MKDGITNKKINYSFELLRLILCFWVVLHHFCKNVNKIKGRFHVPTFMIMSFYFHYNTLKAKNISKLKQRFQRILIPYIVWAIFIFILNNILSELYGFILKKKNLELKDLVLQLIFGSHFHLVFYYQFNLIFLTLLFNIISFLFNNYLIFVFQILLIAAYIFQYSQWNVFIFIKYFSVIRYSLGLIIELLPFAVIGATLCYLNIVRMLKQFKVVVTFFIGIIIFLILEFNIFVIIRGFLYPGLLLNIGGICIFILFSLFSFQNRKLLYLLKIITKFTGGVYYIHTLFFEFLFRKFFFIRNKTFHGSIFIYLLSYITCFLGNKLSFKTKLNLLFN